MSIAHPKNKQIRLPFDVARPSRGAETAARVCGLKQDSRYTCPRCNVAYCSLDCFRSQCSEPFYHAAVRGAIETDRAPVEERRAMLEMLRRFEEGADDDGAMGGTDDEDGSDDEDELAAALNGIDLDHIDTNELFRLLPGAHRAAFLAALQDPESAAARELLDQAGSDGGGDGDDGGQLGRAAAAAPAVMPWWESELGDEPGYAAEPPPVGGEVLADIHPPAGAGDKLVYNILALTLAYLHTLLAFRLPSLASADLAAAGVSPAEARDTIGALAPFLAAKSTARHASVRAAYEATWALIGADAPQPTAVLVRLLRMAGPLLRPRITLDPPRVAGVLGDLHALGWADGTRRKLTFYARAVEDVGRQTWAGLAGEIGKEIERLENEVGAEDAEADGDDDAPSRSALLL